MALLGDLHARGLALPRGIPSLRCAVSEPSVLGAAVDAEGRERFGPRSLGAAGRPQGRADALMNH